MKGIPKEQVLLRMRAENPWWQAPNRIHDSFQSLRRRAYFNLFIPLVTQISVKRAVLLMGPRRVGKTVLLHHTIDYLLKERLQPNQICYLSVDHPLYNGLGLSELLDLATQASGMEIKSQLAYVFFDEIQYLRDWEIHLKSLVDDHPNVKFVASGSAAAALKLKSTESGAGRFTDFLLPPITFHEYLDLLDKNQLIIHPDETHRFGQAADIAELNKQFVSYLNFGGYPEAIFSPAIQADPARFIKSDIVDKVLLRDLPGLYGIQDIPELNSLFTRLAFNTANEVSLEALSQNSGVAKNTIKRYIEYLEAAFLIKIVHRIDRNAKRFERASSFKVYLTNPSIRSALFSPITEDGEYMGGLAETGIFSQWFHASTQTNERLHYARWKSGEVDIVNLNERQTPEWAVEVKWSDRACSNAGELAALIQFCKEHQLQHVVVTTRTVSAQSTIQGIQVHFVPTSLYCYVVGLNLIKRKHY